MAIPTALPVSAMSGNYHHGPIKKPDSYVLKDESNATYRVKTEVSPMGHVAWSTVTNNSNSTVTPTVTFNGQAASTYSNKPLDPGKSRKYLHFFTGNNFTLDVTVTAQGVDPFTSSGVINLPEPVTFTATGATKDATTGTLTNNTTDPQTVYIRGNHKNKITETLNPSESKTITIPSSSAPHTDNDRHHWDNDRKFVGFTIATAAGYKGSYVIPVGYTTTQPAPLGS